MQSVSLFPFLIRPFLALFVGGRLSLSFWAVAFQFIFKYNGPPNHKEQFAIRLLEVLQGAKQAQDGPLVSPNCKYPVSQLK